MTDQKNTILAIALSAMVLIAWQFFVGLPQMEKQRQEAQQKAIEQKTQAELEQAKTPAQLPGQLTTTPAAAQQLSREAAIDASGPRLKIETPRLQGSITLKGGRIDDLALVQYRETVDPTSPPIILLSPSRSPHPFYADFGWLKPPGSTVKVPDDNTVWRQEGSAHPRASAAP